MKKTYFSLVFLALIFANSMLCHAADDEINPAPLLRLHPTLVLLDDQNQSLLFDDTDRLEGEAERNQEIFYERKLPLVWLAIGAIVFVLFFLGKKIVKVIRKHHLEVIEKANTPRSRASKALMLLQKQDLPAKGAFDLFYTQITNTIRLFIEEEYHIKAREQTTEEFLNEATSTNLFDQKTRDILKDFLKSADLVKFAKFKPSTQDCEKTQQLANDFIKS